MNKLNNHHQSERGFTMLIAVVTASILLLIALGMGSIALKEQVLVSSVQDSQTAFYAADSGLECALYLDQKVGAFNNTDPSMTTRVDSACGTSPDVIIPSDIETAPATSTFTVYIPNDSSCAVVTVAKHVSNNHLFTNIDARGYNTCAPSPRRLERGVHANY